MVTLPKPSGMFNENLEILADDLVLLNDKMCVTYCLGLTTCKNISRYNIFRTQQKNASTFVHSNMCSFSADREK